jgi:glycosyltransferase involved in cell wall biosynthesis
MNLEQPKICHLTTVHDPFDDRIFYRECLTLAADGYRVVIVAPANKDEDAAGVRIKALPKTTRRWERMTTSAWRAYTLGLRERADIYHLHDPELLLVGCLLRIRGKRVIFDAHEDVPDDIMTKAWLPSFLRPPLASLLNLLVHFVGMTYSGVVAATPHIAKRFPRAKTAIVANYPSGEFEHITISPYPERPNDMLYIGSLSETRGVLQMVGALTHSAVLANARLTIAGRFGDQGDAAVERRVRSLPGWRRVEFLGWRSRADILRILPSSKVGLLLLHPQKTFVESLPTKLFEYMAAGMPVVASDFPLWRTIIAGAGCGILVDPLDCDAIASAIGFLLTNPQQAESMGLRGRQAVTSQYGWAEQADHLLRLYRSVMCNGNVMAVEHA